MSRYRLPSDFDASALAARLSPGHESVLGQTKSTEVTYLDTFDWRLWNAGLVLVAERDRTHRLVLMDGDQDPHVVTIEATPRMSDDLPRGHLTDRVAPLIGIRALVIAGVARVQRREGRIQNDDGEILALLRTEEVEILDCEGDPAGPPFPTIHIRGCPTEVILDSTAGLVPDTEHDLGAAAEARGRTPGGYSSKLRVSLEPEQPAAWALRTILFELLSTLEANIEGTIDDIDTEFLHDLRVACRRTRSALSQLKGVLPPETVAPFNAEFKWLGDVTGPLRDLDVYLLEMPAYRAALPNHLADDLDPLENLIIAERSLAHASVVDALRSRRFKSLVTRWRRTLDAFEPGSASDGARATVDLAAARISKATRRILKRGSGLGSEPPAEVLHRLRIDAKKLRYLLEFFSSLYPEGRVSARIKELKRLQDILGGFNDMEIQRHRLADFARLLHTDPAVGTSCILTLGRLAGILEERQEAFRSAFQAAFREFSSRPVQNAFNSLFGGREST